jgi:hypothetical protein
VAIHIEKFGELLPSRCGPTSEGPRFTHPQQLKRGREHQAWHGEFHSGIKGERNESLTMEVNEVDCWELQQSYRKQYNMTTEKRINGKMGDGETALRING